MKKIILFVILTVVLSQSLENIDSWAYQLQNLDPNEVTQNNTFELIVMDYSLTGNDEGAYSIEEIQLIKNSGKLAVCYISIGEAENYRSYWQNSWNNNPPEWLGAENPDWEGNFKVKFWYAEWQNIIFNWLDTIITQGFDGIYMDIIDAYYYWLEEVNQNQQEPYSAVYMIDFIENIRNYLNANGGGNMVVIPQNGEYIVWENNVTENDVQRYLNTCDAIGVEDLFFYGTQDMNNSYNPDNERLELLTEVYQPAGWSVFSVEYLTHQNKINQYLEVAEENGFIPYCSVRDLDELTDGFGTVTPFPINSGRLVFHRYSDWENWDGEIFIYDFETQILQNLTQLWNLDHTLNPHFSPDGNKIVFAGVPEYEHEYYLFDVYVWNFLTEELINLTSDNNLSDEDPKFSPDGQSVVFKQNGDLKVMNLQGEIISIVTNDGFETEESEPYFTVNGEQIIYFQGVNETADIYKINLDGTGKMPIQNIANLNEYYPITIDDNSYFFTRSESEAVVVDDIYIGNLYDNSSTPFFANLPNFEDSDPFPVSGYLTLFSSNRESENGDWDLFLGNSELQTTLSLSEFGLNTNLHELGACFTFIYPSAELGDVNSDGIIDISDVILTINYILDIGTEIQNADMNDDGLINVLDIVILIDLISGE